MIVVPRTVSLLALLSLWSCTSPTPHRAVGPVFKRQPQSLQSSDTRAAVRQWSVGRTPVPGGGNGWQFRPFVSDTEFDVDIRESGVLLPFFEDVRFENDISMRLVGVDGALDLGPAVVSCTLAVPQLEDERTLGPESDGGGYFALGASIPFLSKDRWQLGGSMKLSALSTDVASELPTSTVEVDLDALAADVSVSVAYAASSDSLASLSPYGGLGVRVVDGVQDFGASGDLEFDAVLPYAFVGLSVNWRPTEDLGLGIESHVLVGQINGFQLSLVASF